MGAAGVRRYGCGLLAAILLMGANELTDESFIQGFYVRYINFLEQQPRLRFDDILGKIKDSVAPGFYRELADAKGGFDADPFLDAQDWDVAWTRHIRVQPRTQHDGYLVCLGAKGEFRHALKVMVARTAGRQGIASVQAVSVKLCE
jgi:hypothetical protein